ncbi:4-hydroxybenzoate polyprenyltransferase [Desulfuromonas soudanensis]|uniref:4-hydroxybenzoate polyprenyltransferase n=1 Tax=Desulfuromonas soudanensis TaxID=1603606 RepID=A0A0M4DC23_9BACT|nr:UbiA family prenyltransferase [Desulfuromonas soudanensis]ALC18017.1 4-hydroxybenzoate polyprenyltransferase [Desulfuromonas soudanensis]
MTNRWWLYQKERFPIFAHGPLILAFSLSAMSYSALLRGESTLRPAAALVAFVTAFFFFLQLRIADEFKDAADDARWRPYRPVPRGLVTLRELGWIGVGAGVIQLAGSLWLRPLQALMLVIAWVYLALMSREFFVHDWLKAHPTFYLLSHMIILPVFDIYATACDWLMARATPPQGLIWFLAVSYLNGIVIEIGRKIRAPEDEEEGVETYTVLWGRPRALAAWLGAMGLTALCAWRGAVLIGFATPVALLLLILLVSATLVAIRFARHPLPGRGRHFELVSGIWTLVMYLSLGAGPLLLRFLQGGLR